MNKHYFGAALLVAALPVTAVAADTDTGSRLDDRLAITEAPHEMGEHPAVLVARTWHKRGYDYASKFYLHPARLELLAEAPREMGEHPAVLVARTWSKRAHDETTNMATHPALPNVAAVPHAGPGPALDRTAGVSPTAKPQQRLRSER